MRGSSESRGLRYALICAFVLLGGTPVGSGAGNPALQGLPIQEIRLHRENVFAPGEERPAGLEWLYGLANKLHAKTRPFVIRNEILLERGEPFDSLKLAESVRLLRERGIFETVRGWAEPGDSGVVAHIYTQDYWTLNLQSGFSQEGGKTSVLLGIFDSNLLGTGNILSFTQRWSTDRNQSRWTFAAPRLFGRREVLGLQYRENSDGVARAVSLGHAYENHVAPWSYTVSGATSEGRYRIYEDDDDAARVQNSENIASAHVAVFPGRTLQVGGGIGAFLYDYEPRFVAIFREMHHPIRAPVPQRLRMGLLTAGVQRRHFIRTRNMQRYGVVENYAVGWAAQLVYGHNFIALSGDDEANYGGAQAQFSAIAGKWWLLGSGFGSIFWKGGDARQRRALVTATVARRHSLWTLTALQFAGRWGADLPTEERVYLGGSALRGYPLRELDGTRFLLVNTEHRAWTPVEWLFFRLGVSAFWDAALIAGPGEGFGSDWRHGAGLGILVGNRKSSAGLLRVELARRLDGGDAFDLLISMSGGLNLTPRIELTGPVVDVFSRSP